jgi:hypothetical protein
MLETDIFLWDEKEKPIGKLYTEKPVQNSRVNDSAVTKAIFLVEGIHDPVEWLINSKLRIPGGVRPQKIWNFTGFVKTSTEEGTSIELSGLVFRPENLCVACSGTGRYKSMTHRATAKCPGCRGTGFTNVWEEETKVESIKEDIDGTKGLVETLAESSGDGGC